MPYAQTGLKMIWGLEISILSAVERIVLSDVRVDLERSLGRPHNDSCKDNSDLYSDSGNDITIHSGIKVALVK